MNETRSSINAEQKAIVEEFLSTGDALSQYTYLLELSAKLPIMTDEQKASCTLVDKCQSQVWLSVAAVENGTVRISAESDTLIVRGILALILSLFDGRMPDEILESDITFVDETDLRDAFSDERLNGFASICATIKAMCAAIAEADRGTNA